MAVMIAIILTKSLNFWGTKCLNIRYIYLKKEKISGFE